MFDIRFVTDRLCLLRSGGKEYNCLKFVNIEECHNALKSVRVMTRDLQDELLGFAAKNDDYTYKYEMVFLLDDDAPERFMVARNAEIQPIKSLGHFGFSETTIKAMEFVITHFTSSSTKPTNQEAQEETSRDVIMEDAENTSNVQPEQAIVPAIASVDQPLALENSATPTNDKTATGESCTALILGQPKEAEVDPRDDVNADANGEKKQPAKSSSEVPETNGEEKMDEATEAVTEEVSQKQSAGPKKHPPQSSQLISSEVNTEGSSRPNNRGRPSKKPKATPRLSIGAKKALDEGSNISNAQDQEDAAKVSECANSANQDQSKERSSRANALLSSKKKVDTPFATDTSKSASKKTARKGSAEKVKWNVSPITFDDIKSALEKAGFKFTERCFALPNKHPADCKDAKLGEDYFENENDFRKYLCAFGMDDCKRWDFEMRDAICMWVRYHIVDYDDKLPEIEPSKLRNVWKSLTQIGFQYRDTELGARYCLPGDSGIEFDSEAACLEHISRYGFPDNCDYSAMTDVEKIRLQMVIAEAEHADTFKPIEPYWNSPSGARTSSLRKRRHLASQTSAIFSVTKKLKYGGSAKQAKRQGTPKPVSYTPPPRLTQTGEDLPSQSNETPIHISTTVTLSPAGSTILPEFYGTDRERLNACFNALKLSHPIEPTRFDSDGTSRLRANLARVENFLTRVFERASQDYDDIVEDNPPPAALYVCGEPGVGKTSGVMFCCNKLKDEGQTYDFDVKVAKFNASDLKSTDALHQELGSVLRTKATKKAIVSKLRGANSSKKNKPPFLVVVVDEIDMMLSESQLVSTHLKSEQVLKEMLEYTSDPDIKFALIGISNSSGSHKYGRLHQIGKFQEVVTFQTYSDTDLQRILEARVGHSVISENVLKMIAKKVGNLSGDARKALDAAAKAVVECLERTPEDVTSNGPLVKMQDVVKVFRSFEKNYKETIDGLTTAGKVVLCVASVFAKKNQSVALRRLHELVKETLSETSRMDDMIQSYDSFTRIVEMLKDSGLLKSTVLKKKVGTQIELQMPVQDIETVLNQELKVPFYATLRERAASKIN